MQLLRRGPVVGLWIGQTCSVFGDRLYAMAIMWIVWQKSGAAAMGLVAVAESVPYIVFGTIGRRLVARCNSLRALAIVDLFRAGLVATIPLVWSHAGFIGVLVLVLLIGAGGALFDPNLSALVPDLVPPAQVQGVNGLMDLSGRIARIAGPGAAGALLALMPMTALFWVDAATFVASGIALICLAPAATRMRRKAPKVPAAPPAARARARDLLKGRPDTAAAIGVHGVGIACTAVAMAMPALLADRLGAGAAAYGAILAATGAGSLVGNTVAGHVQLKGPAPALYCGLWALSGALLALTGAAFSLPFLLLVAVLSGMVAPFLQITLATHLSRFEGAARLRLMSVDLTVIRTAGTGAMLFVPALAAPNPTVAYAIAGLTTVLVGGFSALWLWRRTPSRAMNEDAVARELVRE
ncbi:MFS transporter [Streptomyces sp. NPDC093109]|uniref:MFS transporter n=1 Tax=Streptomyces sp. NPDC093109 TaxID=3154977 RepID=UPI00344CC266